jgi:hypothetical protein
VLDQSSIPAFIEYNWHLPTLGNGAADANPAVGSITGMLDFRGCVAPLFLNPTTGEPVRDHGRDDGGRCRDGRDTD